MTPPQYVCMYVRVSSSRVLAGYLVISRPAWSPGGWKGPSDTRGLSPNMEGRACSSAACYVHAGHSLQRRHDAALELEVAGGIVLRCSVFPVAMLCF